MESVDAHALVMLAVLVVHLTGAVILTASAIVVTPAFLAGLLGVRALKRMRAAAIVRRSIAR